MRCGGWDLNPRTPLGRGPEPRAFDLAWQPPRFLLIFLNHLNKVINFLMFILQVQLLLTSYHNHHIFHQSVSQVLLVIFLLVSIWVNKQSTIYTSLAVPAFGTNIVSTLSPACSTISTTSLYI